MPANVGSSAGNRSSVIENESSDSDLDDNTATGRHGDTGTLSAHPTYNTFKSASEEDVENGRLPGRDFAVTAIDSTDSGRIAERSTIISSVLNRFGILRSRRGSGGKPRQTSFRSDMAARRQQQQYNQYNLEQQHGGDADQQQQLVLSDTIHQAARTGDVIGLRMLLDMFPSQIRKSHINILDETGSAPLHYAARYNHVEIAKLLLIAGANANVRSEDGQTPLHFSCRYKSKVPKSHQMPHATFPTFASPSHSAPDIQVVPDSTAHSSLIGLHNRHLISNTSSATLASSTVGSGGVHGESLIKIFAAAGANVNARDRYGNTPLHIAVMRANENAVRELLELPDVRVDIFDESKQTPLHIAALSGRSVEILHAIVTRSKDLRATDANSNAPLHLACAQGNLNVVKILLDEARKRFGGDDYVRDMLHDKDDENQIPLMLAVEGGHMAIAKLLLEQGSAIDFPNDNLDTPLHVAANRGDLEMCQLLIEKGGAAVEARNARLQTALHRAAAMDRLPVAEYLISVVGGSSSLEASDQNAWTPMLIAARHGHVDMVRRLIASGANIYAVSKRDRNALFLAASSNHPHTVQALLESPWGRELLFRNDRYGLFPIHIACKKGHLEVVRIMIRKGAPIDERLEDEKTPLHLAAQYGWHHIVELLTSENVDLVNYEDENSDTPLHLAALNGYRDVVVKLIRLGASVVSRNANMWTPLDSAASRGHTAVCEELLKSEAPIDPRDKTSTTPLHLACMAGFVGTAKLLVEYGASVCARDADGKNCLDFAIENGHRAVAMYLIQSSKWRDGLRNDQWVHGGSGGRMYRETPMRKLIRFMPDVAYQALNRCIETRGRADNASFKVVCNYEFIDDTFSHWIGDPPFEDRVSAPAQFLSNSSKLKKGSLPYIEDAVVVKENHPLQVMVRCKQEELLTHPLTTSLIQTKWALFGRYAFFFTFFAYVIFLGFLTAYCMESHPVNRLYYVRTFDNGTTFTYWEPDLCPNGTVWPLSNDVNQLTSTAAVCRTVKTYRQAPYNCTMDFLERESSDNSFLLFFIIGQFVLPILSVFLLLKEAVQFALLRSVANIVAWPVYIMTIIVTVPWDGFNCYNHYGLMPSWEWQLTSFNIFLAWIQLVLLLRNFPWIGLYVQMLEDVTITVMGFFPVFFLVSTAFVLGFFISFQGSVRHDQRADFLEEVYDDSWELNPFYSIPISYVKTFTMVVGEYEQESHFQNTNQPVILVLYVIFLLVCTIIIVNLMIGLAVQDIKAVQDHASLKRVAMRIELVLSVERLAPLWLRVLLFRHRRIIYPNSNRRDVVAGAGKAVGGRGVDAARGSNAGDASNDAAAGQQQQAVDGGNKQHSDWWARAMATERGLGGASVSAGEIARARQRHTTSDHQQERKAQDNLSSAATNETFEHSVETLAGTSGRRDNAAGDDDDIEQKIIGATMLPTSSGSNLMPSVPSGSSLSNTLLLPPDAEQRQQQNTVVVKIHEQILQHVDSKLNAFQNEIMNVLNEIRTGRKVNNRVEKADQTEGDGSSSPLLKSLLGNTGVTENDYESAMDLRKQGTARAMSPQMPLLTLTTAASTNDRDVNLQQKRRGSVRFGDGRVRQISSTRRLDGGGDFVTEETIQQQSRTESGDTTTSFVSAAANDESVEGGGSKRQVKFQSLVEYSNNDRSNEIRRRRSLPENTDDIGEEDGKEITTDKQTNRADTVSPEDSETDAVRLVAASNPPIL